MLLFFAKGLAAGAFIAFPVGPIGIVCLRRMLSQGPLIGIVSGLGGATADAIYSTIAIVGMSFVSSFLMQHLTLLRILSSLFLCALGLKIVLSKPLTARAKKTGGLAEAFISTFILTLTNPLLVLSFAALFALFNVRYAMITNLYSLSALIGGVFIGSSLWWFALGGLTSCLKLQIKPETVKKINNISGILIIISGLFTILTILVK